MSVASLNNGSLQLSELVISNEKYSNATGYVASSSTFSAGVTGTSLSISSFTSTGLITAEDGLTVTSGDITVSTGDITCSNGTITAQKFTGGIVMAIGTLDFPEIAPDATSTGNIVLDSFVGSSTSAYVVSNNSQGLIHLTIAYDSNPSATTTEATITAYNLSTISFSGSVSYSVIAMN